ncbi:MAG: HAMP domain-containing histidine kinase [Anaerolineae bacterium]|nr:HAMP domain-containing histidine kinase [Anaerolineae bacterium]
MSIRLRFTLLYTFILALTLTVFGFTLYTIQAQSTLDSLKQDLQMGANKTADAALRSDSPDETRNPPPDDGQRPPVSFDEFSNGDFQAFPEREIARILDPLGNLVASPFGREEDELPLSEEGLQTLQGGNEWWQTELVSDEEMLIYSRPVIVNDEVAYIVQVARPLTERNRTLQSLVTTLLIAGALITLIAFGIGWLFSGVTFAPIHRITKTAKAIGDERNFARRVDYNGPQDEVGQLANTFNAMLVRLQDAFQKVEHSLQMQRNFVADVSHELRTPLTTLRGNLGLLKRNPSPEMQNDILSDMVDESDRLIRLVNDLLLLARADAGRSLAKEPVEISTVLQEVCRQANQLDSKREINLDVDTGTSIIGDRDAFKQVSLILLDNALKHSNGKINIHAKKHGKQVEVRVQDFGEGMPPEILAHVFDRFYRGDDATGFGLGLPIAKTLVEGSGGEIHMDSETGKGSTVTITFPSAN